MGFESSLLSSKKSMLTVMALVMSADNGSTGLVGGVGQSLTSESWFDR